MKESSKKSVKNSNKLPPHYNDLDAPVFVWNKVHETQDFSWLLRNRKTVSKTVLIKLNLVWDNIYNEYSKEFGYSEQYQMILEKRIEIAILKNKFIQSFEKISDGDRGILTDIQIEEEDLQEMIGIETKGNFMRTKIAIEQYYKNGHINVGINGVSIREFYSYIKNMK